MVFYVTPGIDADEMVAKDGRLCKVQGPPVKMEKDMAPLGDNRNDIVYKGDKVTFPLLFAGKGKPPTLSVLGLIGAKPKDATMPTEPDANPKLSKSSKMKRSVDQLV
jgi:hypothetical protein